MSIIEVITALVALYGAGLATFTFSVQQLEKKHRVKVKLWLGFIGAGQNGAKDIVLLEAANSGVTHVHLSECCIELPDKKENFIARFNYDRDFPSTLAPGESVQAFIDSETFIKAARESGYDKSVIARAKFANKGGDIFRSKEEKLDLDTMLFAEKNS